MRAQREPHNWVDALPKLGATLSLQPRLPLNGNWRNTSYMKKIHNCELLQDYTYPEQNYVNPNIL